MDRESAGNICFEKSCRGEQQERPFRLTMLPLSKWLATEDKPLAKDTRDPGHQRTHRQDRQQPPPAPMAGSGDEDDTATYRNAKPAQVCPAGGECVNVD